MQQIHTRKPGANNDYVKNPIAHFVSSAHQVTILPAAGDVVHLALFRLTASLHPASNPRDESLLHLSNLVLRESDTGFSTRSTFRSAVRFKLQSNEP